jgi:hypothetical protein
MKISRARLAIVFVMWFCVCSSSAFALPPMGPPKAMLGEKQRSLGIGYSYQQMNLEVTGKVKEDQGSGWLDWAYNKYKIEDLTSNVLLGSLGYGLCENFDISALVGMADAKDEVKEACANGEPGKEYTGFDSNFKIVWGFGTKTTFWTDDNISWGGLFQMIWSKFDSGDVKLRDEPTFSGDVELDFWEMQIAVGPTVKLNNLSIYGGPFLHLVKGDLDLEGSSIGSLGEIYRVESKADIREESIFGAYVGLHSNITEEICWFGEYQFTSDAWAAAGGVMLRF